MWEAEIIQLFDGIGRNVSMMCSVVKACLKYLKLSTIVTWLMAQHTLKTV